MFFAALITFGSSTGFAQLVDSLYMKDISIDPLKKGELSVEIDNVSFFKDNEFVTTVQKGYTLPGFWLQLKSVYYPLANMKIEVGVHSIWFWGTTLYPAFAYKDIAKWEGQDYSHNVHILPFFRAHIAFSDNLSVIMGDLYGESAHRLIEPLYNQELNLTSDPENGLQALYKNKWIDLDLWIDWMTYIYKLDTHQEAFWTGLSSRFKVNHPQSRVHVYFPVQGLIQHRGGEIDATNGSTQTIMNGAAGTGITWNVNRGKFQSVNAEFDMTGYIFPKGRTSPLERGKGYYAKAEVKFGEFNVRSSYWYCDNFVTIFGNPFFGSVSSKIDGMLYKRPQMLGLSADYVHTLGKGVVFGITGDMFYNVAGRMYSADTGLYEESSFGSNSNFSFGIYLRFNPSFLIKRY